MIRRCQWVYKVEEDCREMGCKVAVRVELSPRVIMRKTFVSTEKEFGFHKAKHFIGHLSDILARRFCVMNSLGLF